MKQKDADQDRKEQREASLYDFRSTGNLDLLGTAVGIKTPGGVSKALDRAARFYTLATSSNGYRATVVASFANFLLVSVPKARAESRKQLAQYNVDIGAPWTR